MNIPTPYLGTTLPQWLYPRTYRQHLMQFLLVRNLGKAQLLQKLRVAEHVYPVQQLEKERILNPYQLFTMILVVSDNVTWRSGEA